MNAWIVRGNPNPSARLRLFCFPHAGGGAWSFRGWPRQLPSDLEVLVVQPPGREERIGEPAFTRLGPLVEAAVAALTPHLEQPYAFFGHSFGALVAFEAARRLRRLKLLLPTHLVVSGRRAPTCPRPGPALHLLSDAELRDRLRNFQGTPEEVLQNPAFLRVILPTLRADITACETHQHVPDEPLEFPLEAFGGNDDPDVSRSDLEAWRMQTAGRFGAHRFPGGHFYLQNCPEFFRALAEVLAPAWKRPPADLVLRPGDIHVWQAPLDLPGDIIHSLAATLNAEERERAGRFLRAADRDQFLAAHGALRSILGRYLGVSPARVELARGRTGKPEVVQAPLRFNLSHSGTLALIAAALDNEIGVDVEQLRPMPEALSIAESYFAASETAALRRLDGAAREEAFFRCWTCKEAYLKARGGGLSLGLDRSAPADGWWLAELAPAKGYVGACAARESPGTLARWTWGPGTSSPFAAVSKR